MMVRYVRKEAFGNLTPGELYNGYVSFGPIYQRWRQCYC